jgi:hypothetical protein
MTAREREGESTREREKTERKKVRESDTVTVREHSSIVWNMSYCTDV